MTAFETTIWNIQKVLDVINKGSFSSKVQIAKAVGVSPTLMNNIFKRIEPEIRYVDSTYKAACVKAEETEFYNKFSKPLAAVMSDLTIMCWQNKYISAFFGLSMNEVQTLRAYVYDEIHVRELH